MAATRRRVVLGIALGVVAVLLGVVAAIAVPILQHVDRGSPGTAAVSADGLSVRATGDDGRSRELRVAPADGIDLTALRAGDRLVVTGTGYDGHQGVYVAVCAVPASASLKPGPCIGGVPSGGETEVAEGTVEYTPSTWINDGWAWRLAGARAWDDADAGSFTAYVEVGDPVSDALDCTAVACAIYTRNDHTAASDRSQDLAIPVVFAG